MNLRRDQINEVPALFRQRVLDAWIAGEEVPADLSMPSYATDSETDTAKRALADMINNTLWNLDRPRQYNNVPLPLPTGTRREQGLELLKRCDERETRLAKMAVESERDGDDEFCWIAMAARAENKRLRDNIATELECSVGYYA
jgi:broad specificity polyphosphatase/5'/3'-nucleotidase SurE